MSLSIIKGPPNSGRTELVRERFEARLADDPVLVVPSTDDIFGWERRLTRDRGAFLGGKVVHFKDLVDEILGHESSTREFGHEDQVASPLRRRTLAAAAIRAGWPAIALRLRDQPGLIDAALRTIDEFRENLIDPERFDDATIAESVGPIAYVYREYLKELSESELTDHPKRAAAASTRSLAGWQGRPVFVAGFDDMTARQLELIRRLAAETDVTVAMTHEQGNQAMAITEGLLGRLRGIGGTVVTETSRPQIPPDHNPLLVELERAFLDRSKDGSLLPDEAVTLIEASGRRGEAEAIGAEIARLVDGGVDPGEIAIAIDAPATNGGPIRDILGEYGIPATLEAETKAPETVTGQAALNLLRAGSADGGTEDFFSLLRGPLGLDRGAVDRVEFDAVRKGTTLAADAKAIADRHGLKIPGWAELEAGDPGAAVKVLTRICALTLTTTDSASLPGASTATETQTATAISQAVDELTKANEGALTAAQIEDALLSGVVKTWAVPIAHTVRIASPYSMRAKRAGYLFIASLQERDLGLAEGSPLMSRDARGTLEMPDLTDQEQQETYLFYSCLAVPTKRLWLSHRVADVHGKAEFPSAMIGEVTRLFEDGGAGLRVIRRSSSDIVFPESEAPAEHEWALSRAASGATGVEPDPSLAGAAGEVARARQIDALTSEFRDIESPAARAGLAGNTMFSATALETFIECPYKWFFERAMSPVRFGPDPDAIARGNLIHDVLADLYRTHPGELPGEADVDEWVTAMEELVEERAGRFGLGEEAANHQILRRQVKVEVTRFLRREADRSESVFRPIAFEQRFGFDDEDSMPALEEDGWQLRGSIDRVDRGPEGGGVVIDYKSGASSYKTRAEISREGKVQLQLYLRALEKHWGLEPAAGLYVPIFAAKKAARGLVDEEKAGSLKDMGLVKGDFTPDLDAEIEQALELASIAAGKILRGEIAHDPSDCLNHFEHAGVPDRVSGPESDESGDR